MFEATGALSASAVRLRLPSFFGPFEVPGSFPDESKLTIASSVGDPPISAMLKKENSDQNTIKTLVKAREKK